MLLSLEKRMRIRDYDGLGKRRILGGIGAGLQEMGRAREIDFA